MLISRILACMSAAAVMPFGASGVCGQDYPSKPIRVLTQGLGGGTDFVARLVAQGISGPLGQQIIVDNRGGIIPGEIAAKAPPDGYTLLVMGQTHWISPLLQAAPYDPIKDFAPITYTDRSPSVIAVHPSVPVKSVKELIALAKAKPGQLNYSNVGLGSATHLATELFKAMAGVNIVQIPYKNNATALTDLLAGQVHLRIGGGTPVAPHIKSGKLMALAVSTAQPSPLFPGLPTIAASGVPGYEAVSITAVFAPAKTPAAIINRQHQEIIRFLKTPEAKERILSTGAEVVGSSPEELAAYVKSDMTKYGKVIKDAGIKAE